MIAVKAVYHAGKIEFLEPAPTLTRTPVIVVFLDPEWSEEVAAPAIEPLNEEDWGEAMDKEGAELLVALHEELAPYRTEANRTWDAETRE